MDHTDHARRRSRRGAAALGLIALPLVGSAFVLPTVLPSAASAGTVTAGESVTVRSAATVTTPSPDDDTAAVLAFLDAGYTWEDATVLAELWGLDQDVYLAKVKAGTFLADGVALVDSPFADPAAGDGFTDDQLVDVFVAAGHGVADAEVLAQEWGIGDLTEAKVKAGRELKAVGVLPFVDPAPVESGDSTGVTAFFDAGYDYDDAVLLAGHWGLPEPYDAKVKAGSLLEDGTPLPGVAGVGI